MEETTTGRRFGGRVLAAAVGLALLPIGTGAAGLGAADRGSSGTGSAGTGSAADDPVSDAFLSTWRDGDYTGTSLWDVRNQIEMGWGASANLNGSGVGVALIDTGVAPVPALSPSQVVNGPDLSFESQAPNLRYLDTYGHGTHMAAIIIGNGVQDGHMGLARGAKLTSVKVGTANGTVDVSQVIAAIDWVVKNRNHDPANPIRVINLAYGSGGTPSSTTDPLAFAVEQAWKAGIVVVAAAGNQGAATLSNPARDPFVLSVGAAHTAGTDDTRDDTVSTFTNGRPATRSFDITAPGEGIFSARLPGGNIDNAFPAARIDATLFRGSGTSQATAVVSSVVALLLQARPSLTPDQVKKILISSGYPLAPTSSGKKIVNVNRALATATPPTGQSGTWSTGVGLLESSRGPAHVVHNGVTLSGEKSIFGPFDTRAWAAKSAARTSWSGGVFNGVRLAGDDWTGSSWASKTWAPATWSGVAYSGGSWVDPNWQGRFWAGRFWSAGTWQSRFWASGNWYSTM